jgi:site-specific DNA recombinase
MLLFYRYLFYKRRTSVKVAIYIRVSTEEQAKEGYSIDAQKQRLTEFVRSQGWEIYEFYIDDGYSAKDLERPNVQRMIKDIRSKKFDIVLVYRLDRLVRSVINLHELLQLFDKHDVKFKSATEMFDTTSAMGRFFITLVGAMAQWERENLAERVKMGMSQKHAEGGRNGAVAPFGYDLVDGQLIVNPIEAEIVKRIYTLYRQNNGALAIAKRFNREGVPKRETGRWNYNAVYYILTNPVYCGKVRWNYRKQRGQRTGEEIIVDGTHEPLITEEEFNEIQRMREERAREGKVVTSDYPFTGVLRCGRCGYAMVGGSRPRKNGRRRFYKCLGRFSYGLCDMPIISEDSVETSFKQLLAMNEIEISKKLIEEEMNSDTPDSSKVTDDIEKELEAIKKRKRKWQDAFAGEAITLEELKELTAEDTKREEYLKQELERLQEKGKSSISPEFLAKELNSALPLWEENEDYSRKQFVNSVFEVISVHTDVKDATGGPGKFVPVELKFKPRLQQ